MKINNSGKTLNLIGKKKTVNQRDLNHKGTCKRSPYL